MRRVWSVFAFALVVGCVAKVDERHAGSGSMDGTLTGLTLSTEGGFAIAENSTTGTPEVKVAAQGLACEDQNAGDRITIDFGSTQVGTFKVVPGYPYKSNLTGLQARAHACPANFVGNDCNNHVQGGTIVVTKNEAQFGGYIEGTFELTFPDGTVSGSFRALYCD